MYEAAPVLAARLTADVHAHLGDLYGMRGDEVRCAALVAFDSGGDAVAVDRAEPGLVDDLAEVAADYDERPRRQGVRGHQYSSGLYEMNGQSSAGSSTP